jgi:hypothetical protein
MSDKETATLDDRIGCWGWSQTQALAIAMIRRLARMGAQIEDMVTHQFPLRDINKAMRTNIALEGD